MLAYIDAGTAAAIAAMATGGLAGAKVAAQSFFYRGKAKAAPKAEQVVAEVDEVDTEDLDEEAPAFIQQQAA